MNVYVCVGSSCHLKNSKGIIDKLTKLIEENNIKANVELKGSFCMGQCGKDGVSVKIDDEVLLCQQKKMLKCSLKRRFYH